MEEDEEEALRKTPELMHQDDDGLFFPKPALTSLTATLQDARKGVGNMLHLLDPTSRLLQVLEQTS